MGDIVFEGVFVPERVEVSVCVLEGLSVPDTEGVPLCVPVLEGEVLGVPVKVGVSVGVPDSVPE